LIMKINTEKIKKEVERLGITLTALGEMMEPPASLATLSYLIHHGKNFSSIERVAKALHLDPKDLILS